MIFLRTEILEGNYFPSYALLVLADVYGYRDGQKGDYQGWIFSIKLPFYSMQTGFWGRLDPQWCQSLLVIRHIFHNGQWHGWKWSWQWLPKEEYA